MICTFFDVFGRFLPRPVLHTHPFAVSNEPARPYATDKRHKFNDHVQATYYRIVWDIVDARWHQEFQHTIKTTLDFAGKLKNRTIEDWRRNDRVSACIMLLRCSKKYPWMKRSVTSRDGHILYKIYQHHKASSTYSASQSVFGKRPVGRVTKGTVLSFNRKLYKDLDSCGTGKPP